MSKVSLSLSPKVETFQKYQYTKIDSAATEDKSEILIRFSGGREIRLRAKSGLFIAPHNWNAAKGEIKSLSRIGSKEVKELQALKTKLDNLCNEITTAFADTDTATANKQWLESIIEKYNHPENYHEEQKDITLFSWIDNFIENAPNRKVKKTNRNIGKSIQEHYRATARRLHELAESEHKNDYEFSEIDKDFYKRFVAFLQTIQITERNGGKHFLRENSVAKHIKVLKTFLNDTPKELSEKIKVKTLSEFSAAWENVDNVYLNEAELKKILDYDFSNKPHLARVRDQFLLLCYTGCRYSDLDKLNKDNIKNDCFYFHQQKTNTDVVIPLHPIVSDIMKKYKYKLPPMIEPQKFNEEIKEVAAYANIDNKETLTRTEGGKITKRVFKKYEIISSHTGRRSFCTNMYKLEVPTLTIMAISGHKSETSFLKYIKVDKEEHAKLMAQQWAKLNKK